MKNENLATYLNDHLAGSIAAIEMIEHLITVHKGTPVGHFCEELHADISSDQSQLQELMRSLEVKESNVRKTSAWVAEKLSRPKLGAAGNGANEVGMFEALEGLLLGILGKESLWRALEAVKENWPEVDRVDFARLRTRAIEQGQRVDAKRLEVARRIFLPRP